MAEPPLPPSPPGSPTPIGAAPEGHDYSHPWIVSAIVSALCFAIGFAVLYFSGLWTKLLQWADAPFMFYFAILAPVLFGFTMYGIYLAFAKLFGWERKRRPAHPAPSEKEPGA